MISHSATASTDHHVVNVPSRRQAIRQVARKLFCQQGYPATSIDQIARAAGLSVGSIYNIVGNKDQLYGRIAKDIGHELLDYLRQDVVPLKNAEQAIAKLVRHRLQHHPEHRLFLVLFSNERSSGVYPSPEQVEETLPDLYRTYLQEVGDFLARYATEKMPPLHLALTFEGMISAFAAYLRDSIKGEGLTGQTQYITSMFLRLARSAPPLATDEAGSPATDRCVYVSRFDYDRLHELVEVARVFGSHEQHEYLVQLTNTLQSGKIVDPHVVPPDVVTMNSRFTLADEELGAMVTCTLVFPTDSDNNSKISVLSPLGAMVLGARPGDQLIVPTDKTVRRFTLLELLYQPESAGDYHL